MTSSNFQFFYQAARLTIFLDDEQHVADIYPDAALQAGLVEIIAAHGLPIAVESQAEELTARVEHGAARVTARDVVIRNEADLHLSAPIGITAVVAALQQAHQLGLQGEVGLAAMLAGLLQNATYGGEVAVMRPVGRIIAPHRAEAEAHR